MRKGQAIGGGPRILADKNTSLRLPEAFEQRADALIHRLHRVPEYVALGPFSRNKVLRLAIAIGLEALEAKHSATLKGGKP